MNNIKSAIKLTDNLYSTCNYFLPRLLFLQSQHAPHIHWGDIAIALNNFPPHHLDIHTSEFWDYWMQGWSKLGDHYCTKAITSKTEQGKRNFFRSAAACYHWAEFMYFADSTKKIQLRKRMRDCFEKSIDHEKIALHSGVVKWRNVDISYYLIFPDSQSHPPGPVPCVILSNGLDSATEVEILAFAERFLSRGLAVLLFDGPGQGINLGVNPLEIQIESVITLLIDMLRYQTNIAINHLGFFGISFGGYFALRVANTLSKYFKGVINIAGGPYLTPFDKLKRRLKEDFKYAFMEESNASMQQRFDDLKITMSRYCKTDILSVHGSLDDIFPIQGLFEIDEILGKYHQLKIYESEVHASLNYINEYSSDVADWMKSKLAPQPSINLHQKHFIKEQFNEY